MRILPTLVLGTLLFTSPAVAGEVVLGFGTEDADRMDGAIVALQLEVHTDPVATFSWGSVSPMLALEIDSDRDLWLGLGLSAMIDLSPKWFVEASLAPGYYRMGSDGDDLGGNFQFRTLIGVGYRFDATQRISFGVDHLSNAGLEDRNPGRNAIFLRYGRSF